MSESKIEEYRRLKKWADDVKSEIYRNLDGDIPAIECSLALTYRDTAQVSFHFLSRPTPSPLGTHYFGDCLTEAIRRNLRFIFLSASDVADEKVCASMEGAKEEARAFLCEAGESQ